MARSIPTVVSTIAFPRGTVDLYADLPDYTIHLGEVWFVENPKTFSLHPRGFYEASASGWVNTTIKVTLSMDSGTLINWADWGAYLTASNGIAIGDRLLFNGVLYSNLTGVEIATPPNLDTTNWELAQKAIYTTYDNTTSLLKSVNIQEAIDEMNQEKTTYHGVVELPSLVNNLDGTISIGTGVSNFGTVANGDGVIVRLATPSELNISLTDNAVNYVYADYSSGSPTINVTLNPMLFLPDARAVPLFRVVKEGTELHYLDYDRYGIGLADKMFNKDIALRGFERQSGLILSTATTRISTISAGSVWFGVQLFPLSQNIAGTTGALFEYYLTAGVWNESLVTEYDSLYYSDGTNRIALSNNKYVAKYFYIGVELDSHAYFIHGNQYNSLSEALAEQIPTIPSVVSSHSLYVGKIIIQKDATNGVAYPRDWGGSVQSTGATSHEDLSNILQAGTGVLNGHINDQDQVIAGDKTFTDGISVANNITQSAGITSLLATTITGDLDISGKIGIDGTQIGYLPNQTNFLGTLYLGNGGASLSHTTGTEGYYNTFIGINSGNSNTTGSYNTTNGYASLNLNTTGSYNTVNGYNSLNLNTTGYRNTANGAYSLYSNTTGSNNNANGAYSLHLNTTGYQNTANGYQAGRFIVDGSTPNQTGRYNVFLGSNTKALADGDENEIVIGYNAIGAGSNSVVLGNVSITKTILKGNVGIGTTTPNSKLEVNGTTTITGDLIVTGTPEYADNATAITGGLSAGTFYRTGDIVKVVH